MTDNSGDLVVLSRQATGQVQRATLVRFFFVRLLETEFTPRAGDGRALFAWLIALFAVPGLAIPFLTGFRNIAAEGGSTALRIASASDKVMYLGASMLLTALLMALLSPHLLTDRRDATVLGPLPLEPGIAIRARLMALGGFVGLLACLSHAPGAILFGLVLSAGDGFAFAVRGTLAHFVASAASSLCVAAGAAAVVVIAGCFFTGRNRSRLVGLVPMMLVACCTLGLLSLPTISASAPDTLLGFGDRNRPWILYTPPVWFLGLYEWLLGDGGPSGRMTGDLARVAGSAVVTTVGLAIALYPTALKRTGIDQRSAVGQDRNRRSSVEVLATLLARSPQKVAVIQFFLLTVTRVERHRILLWGSLGAALAWTAPSWLTVGSDGSVPVTTALLALPIATMTFVLIALRVATAVPSDLVAAESLCLAVPSCIELRDGLERVLMALVVLPSAALWLPVYAYLWGVHLALLHTGVAVLSGTVLVQCLIWRSRAGLPCSHPLDARVLGIYRWWPMWLGGIGGLVVMLAAWERNLLMFPTAANLVLANLAIGVVAMRHVGRRLVLEMLSDDHEAAEVLSSALRS